MARSGWVLQHVVGVQHLLAFSSRSRVIHPPVATCTCLSLRVSGCAAPCGLPRRREGSGRGKWVRERQAGVQHLVGCLVGERELGEGNMARGPDPPNLLPPHLPPCSHRPDHAHGQAQIGRGRVREGVGVARCRFLILPPHRHVALGLRSAALGPRGITAWGGRCFLILPFAHLPSTSPSSHRQQHQPPTAFSLSLAHPPTASSSSPLLIFPPLPHILPPAPACTSLDRPRLRFDCAEVFLFYFWKCMI